ncbi:MAG TPA: translation initiation factor [Cryomorphaceae bacterium]|nr:translation initiation factor [Owenweeksia sp.]HAD96367.1 translation initiation factor [Cryomorphaceae bacterium]HBF19503.1 translation initiation factor [Cryomorphaceae bacterium]|tara:strand:- start:43 stop:396 length:354 start_codon:yes stop_codon:yes gene_type:complete
MAKGKKLNSLEDLGGLVYSTGSAPKFEEEHEEESLPPGDQYLEAHIEKKGRGGKTAVLIKGFEGSDDELKELAKKLKSHCAVGGSSKDGEIIIQGDVRDKAMDFLKKEGYNVKRVGG